MKKGNVKLWLSIFAVLALLYWLGGYVIFNITYVLCFIFLIFHVLCSISTGLKKTIQLFVDAVIMVLQILFNTLILRPLIGAGAIYSVFRLLGVLLILAPFVVERLVFVKAHQLGEHSDGQEKS